MSPAANIRSWLKETLDASPFSSAKAWAERAGVNPSTLQRALRPDYEFVTSSRTLAKLASVAGVAPPDIEGLNVFTATRQEVRYLPIRYEVGAGIWRSVDDQEVAYGEGPVVSDDRYAQFPQWLERVVTDSMDKEYPVGALLHVVDAIALGYAPQHGDHVIIERTEDGGRRERSVKEVVVTRAGIELWPRSNNPRWSGPISVSDGKDQDHCTVQTVALVLGSYRSRR